MASSAARASVSAETASRDRQLLRQLDELGRSAMKVGRTVARNHRRASRRTPPDRADRRAAATPRETHPAPDPRHRRGTRAPAGRRARRGRSDRTTRQTPTRSPLARRSHEPAVVSRLTVGKARDRRSPGHIGRAVCRELHWIGGRRSSAIVNSARAGPQQTTSHTAQPVSAIPCMRAQVIRSAAQNGTVLRKLSVHNHVRSGLSAIRRVCDTR